eukprot:SAG25_NODE_6_length_29267_cov_21.188803_12_plen_67_part_00
MTYIEYLSRCHSNAPDKLYCATLRLFLMQLVQQQQYLGSKGRREEGPPTRCGLHQSHLITCYARVR